MSMPSSRELVATTQRSSPDFSAASTWARCSLLTEPWCARAMTSGAPRPAPDCAMICAGGRAGIGGSVAGSCSSAHNSFSRAVSRSAVRLPLVKTSVERPFFTVSYTCCSTCGQIEEPAGASAVSVSVPGPARRGSVAAAVPGGGPGSAMSSTGSRTVTSQRFSAGGATTVTGRSPPRKAATRSIGRTVADSATRCTSRPTSASRRSRLRARWLPRLVPATAWISSTITVSTPVSVCCAELVSMRYSDSGVVIRMSGGRRSSAARSLDVVSPERTPIVTSARGVPSRSAASLIPVSGARRLRSTSTPSAFSGETYTTRVPFPATVPDPSESMAQRKAASVLPDPVGAATSACSPAAMARHASACTAVGAAKTPANHSLVGGEKRASGSTMGAVCHRPPTSRRDGTGPTAISRGLTQADAEDYVAGRADSAELVARARARYGLD